jgi:hypothetical protein
VIRSEWLLTPPGEPGEPLRGPIEHTFLHRVVVGRQKWVRIADGADTRRDSLEKTPQILRRQDTRGAAAYIERIEAAVPS